MTSQPFQQTRAATNGPDVTAQLGGAHVLAQVKALVHASGVSGYSGPYPVAGVVLRARGVTAQAMAEGRDVAPASVDQPKLTAGSWVSNGGVVIERTFADALGVTAGSRVTLNGRPYMVAGIAVTAAFPPYPNLCYTSCDYAVIAGDSQVLAGASPGLIWLTQADTRSLAAGPLAYVVNLRLSDPASAQAFASEHGGSGGPDLTTWQAVSSADGLLVADEQQILTPGSWLLGLLAVASVAVLVGGRMAEQTRRVGLLKAVGGIPGLVAAALLAENLVLALLAAAAGLAAGWLAAPLLTNPGAALVGTPGPPSLTLSDAGLVAAVALTVALAATLVPAVRAARTSTVGALADSARPPKRRAWLTAISARLPVPLLLGLRLAARRPRRAVLSAASIAVTVTGIVAVLAFHAAAGRQGFGGSSGLGNPVYDRDEQVLLVLTVAVVALAVLNAVFTAWATVLDARRPAALARALGVTPQQLTAGLSAAQVLPALPGAILGIPLGIGLFAVANSGGVVAVPPAWWLAAAVLGTLLAVAGLTAIPARIATRRPPPRFSSPRPHNGTRNTIRRHRPQQAIHGRRDRPTGSRHNRGGDRRTARSVPAPQPGNRT